MRIRTIKPIVCTSRSVARLSSDSVRLYWERLWMYADDAGRGVEEPRLIKAALFPLDDDKTPEVIAAYQAELEAEGMIVRYWWKGERVFAIPEWHEHQKIDRPKESEIPPPDQGDPEPPPCEESSSPRRANSEPSSLEVEVEGNGTGKGTPSSTNPSASTALVLAAPGLAPAAPDGVTIVFDAWREATGHERARLDDKRRRVIRKALKDYDLPTVVDAVRGWRYSPHHSGQNANGTVYDDIGLLLRDAAHIERFANLEREHHQPGQRYTGRLGVLNILSGGVSA